MCMVAAGQLDAHFTYGIRIWDIAAGDLIVREAGGFVVDTSGLWLISRSIEGGVAMFSSGFVGL